MHYDVDIGTKLEGFEITGRLGSGGAGSVFRARRISDGKDVALKTLTANTVVNEEIHKRFIREISVAQKLNHGNIVAYDHCGVDENVLFYTMELVPWGTLGEVLARKGRLSFDEAIECALHIARGLEYLHQAHIVHRDLKPANIFLSDDGRLKIGDFGLARDLGSSRLTIDGFTVGTAKYLSPEQAMGKSEIDGRTDLYALGCLLFEMLAGRPPFVNSVPGPVNSHEIMGKHVREKPPLVSDLVPGCPPALTTLVDRLLAKNAADRPQSATDLCETLESLLKHPESSGNATSTDSANVETLAPETLTSRLRGRDAEQRKLNYGALAAIVVVIIAGVAIAVVRSRG
jgi:eukaryotic-like serine/threonine-protein kinase